MRRPIAAGNWKMHKTLDEARALASDLRASTAGFSGADIVVAPPAVALDAVSQELVGSPIKLAAQNMHWATGGAYTGELSPVMLDDAGCSHVILGHSERRQLFGESDEGVNRKLRAAIAHRLAAIVCIGESLEEREEGVTRDKVGFQVRAALSGVAPEELGAVIVAYEPIWAIGTGKTATPEQAQEVHQHIRQVVGTLYGEEQAEALRILYGGSVKPTNVEELIAQPDIDGALVGGASLRSDSFTSIAEAIHRSGV